MASHLSILSRSPYQKFLETSHSLEREWNTAKSRFFPGDSLRESGIKIINYIKSHDKTIDPIKRRYLINLADKIIVQLKGDKKVQKIITRFDHYIGKFRRTGSSHHFIVKENANRFKKWQRYGFDVETFYQHYDFVDFLFSSNLASQMKVAKEHYRINDGKPYLLVEGKWISFDQFKDKFDYKIATAYFKEPFIYKKDTREVYTYLDRGEGLVKHHPFKDFEPITKLSVDEYKRTLELGKKFVREESTDEEKTHVIQVLADHLDGKGNFLTNNLNEFFFNSQHPHLRLIDKNGDVYSIGFAWPIEKESCLQALTPLRGRFRMPDVHEYKNPAERIATNIAISEREAQRLIKFIKTNLNDNLNFKRYPAFQLLRQNCTVFVREAVKYATGIEIPTEISLLNVAGKITPDCIKTPTQKAGNQITKYSPERLRNVIHKIFVHVMAFLMACLCTLLGEYSSGNNSKKFVDPDQVDEPFKGKYKEPRFWYDINQHQMNHPQRVIEWQRKQPSTVIYHNPIKLNVAPPAA